MNAKSNYRAAYETGDADKVLEAQQALNDAQYRLNKIADIKLKPLQTEGGEVKQEQQIQTEQARRPVRDERAESWREKNAWFGSDDEMTSLALGYHNKLIKEQGVDPKSDEYYEKIDSRMRKLFPEAFDEEPEIEVSRGSKPDVVAPTTRSTTPKKVRLNRSQLAVAEAMGLTPLQYAEQVATLSRTK